MKNVIQGTILSGTGAVSIAPGAEITIRNPAGQLVPLWADRAGTQPHDNPFLADNEGNFRVYADSGWVHIRAQKNGSVREWRYVPIGSAAAMNIGEVYEALGSEIYSSVSEGLSNSAEGDYFLVESSGSLDLYRVVNGVAEQREHGIDADAVLATRAYADGVAAEAESNATNAAVAAASAAYQQATEYSDSQLQTHRGSDDHDHRYYTKTEVDQALSTKVDDDDPRLSDPREWTAEVVSQAEAEAGTSTVPRKWTAERVRQAIEALGGGIDPGNLGTAATRDVTTSPTDTTPGRVLTVGSLGLGEPILLTSSDDLDDIMSPGIYRHTQGNAPANTPIPEAGIVTVFTGEPSSFVVQVWRRINGQVREFQRTFEPNSGVWGSWVEFYHSGNLVLPIGVGQTWQNVASSRSSNTTYTNTTGRPIAVAITVAGSQGCSFIVGGVDVSYLAPNWGQFLSMFAIVPPGSTYRLNTNNNVERWAELR